MSRIYISLLNKEFPMQFAFKLMISIAIIIFCTQVGRKFPSLGGLIATMPLTGVIVLVWLYADNPGNFSVMEDYTKGALWGIVPSILFFIFCVYLFSQALPPFISADCKFRHLVGWCIYPPVVLALKIATLPGCEIGDSCVLDGNGNFNMLLHSMHYQ